MQLKFNRQQGLGQTLFKKFIKIIVIVFILVIAIFVLEKINFPSPNTNQKIDITNEIIKLK